jgi:hypothetical protein
VKVTVTGEVRSGDSSIEALLVAENSARSVTAYVHGRSTPASAAPRPG